VITPIQIPAVAPQKSSLKTIHQEEDMPDVEASVWDMAVTGRQAAIEANRLWGKVAFGGTHRSSTSSVGDYC
jgi:hypothetical protein